MDRFRKYIAWCITIPAMVLIGPAAGILALLFVLAVALLIVVVPFLIAVLEVVSPGFTNLK